MGFMEKAGATIATKYGTVIEGKHKGTVVALGNDPTEKVSVTNQFKQIIFLDGTEEKGRYDIHESFKSLELVGNTDKGFKMLATFNDGEHFVLELEWKKEDNYAMRLFKIFIGAKKAEETPKEKAEAKYRPIKVFTNSFFEKLNVETAEFLLKLYKKFDILDDSLNKSLTDFIIKHKK